MTALSFASHGTQDLYPTFLERVWKLGPSARTTITVIATVGAIAGSLLFGLISDHIGRRRTMIVALAGAIVLVPLWAFPPSLLFLTIGAVLIQCMVQGAWGAVPAHLSELSPDSVRGFLPGFAYQCGVVVSGSIVFLQARFAEHFSYATTMALSAGVVFLGGSIVAALGRERHRTVFGSIQT